MSDNMIFYTECRANGNVDWCTYACIDARDNQNDWYYESERDEACLSEQWYDYGPVATEGYTWENCRIDQNATACFEFCHFSSWYDITAA